MHKAFGQGSGGSHTVDQETIRGQEIYWGPDKDEGILIGFTPVDLASDELIEMFKKEREADKKESER